jgi:hypothetical protein
MTPGITQDFGPNTGGCSAPPERSLGDPYRPVCDQLHALLTRKRGYYGCPDESPLENARGVKDQGIEPWVYQLARIGEKVRRSGGLQAQGRTVGTTEDLTRTIRETLLDIAGHAVVAIALLDNPEE